MVFMLLWPWALFDIYGKHRGASVFVAAFSCVIGGASLITYAAARSVVSYLAPVALYMTYLLSVRRLWWEIASSRRSGTDR